MAQIEQFDLGKAFDTGRKMNQAINYYPDRQMAIEDRQRGIDKENYGFQRQAEQDKQKRSQMAQKDLGLYLTHTKPDNPNFMQNTGKFLKYFKEKYPEDADEITKYEQMPEEDLKMFVGNLRSQAGLDTEKDEFEKGTPYVNDAGKRVVPIYNKNTKELIRTEELGTAKKKKEQPSITWTPEQIDYMADKLIATGEKPMKTRGKEANYLNQIVEKRAAEKQMAKGVGGAETAFLQKDRKAIQSSITAQEKQRGSMVSFVANLSAQVDHVKDIASEINTFDARFLNKPLRWVKKRLKGDPQLSKYEVYLGEIQSEIGKLSSGSTGSVAELSQGAREKWESILDENLSINDMIQILEEVKEAGNIRMESVDTGLRTSRAMLRKVGLKDNGTGKSIDYKKASNEDLEKILRGE